jgi:hypothetical protein
MLSYKGQVLGVPEMDDSRLQAYAFQTRDQGIIIDRSIPRPKLTMAGRVRFARHSCRLRANNTHAQTTSAKRLLVDRSRTLRHVAQADISRFGDCGSRANRDQCTVANNAYRKTANAAPLRIWIGCFDQSAASPRPLEADHLFHFNGTN